MNIIGTGLSGLIGSRIVEILGGTCSFEDLSLARGVDITDRETVLRRIGQSSASWVIHAAAMTDVDKAEKERISGTESRTWEVNVTASRHVVDACGMYGKRLLYISTDFVFDGTKDIYTEEDTPKPQGWYAVTKYEAEKLVTTLGNLGLIVRISFPYRAVNTEKKDFLHRILDGLAEGKDVHAPDDQQFVPTFIDDISAALLCLMMHDAYGIYHAVGSQCLTPYEAGLKIADAFGFPKDRIKPISFARYYGGKAPRPFHAHLVNDKISKFGISMSTFDKGLEKIKRQSDQ